MQTVLVTGAAGGIGARLRQLLKGVYRELRLSDIKRPADLASAVRGFNDHLQTSKPKPAQLNPFDELQAANREHAQLVERLQALTNRLVGETPSFNAIEDEVPAAKPSGLMPLAASVAQLIQERSRHGVSLIDRIEENLG